MAGASPCSGGSARAVWGFSSSPFALQLQGPKESDRHGAAPARLLVSSRRSRRDHTVASTRASTDCGDAAALVVRLPSVHLTLAGPRDHVGVAKTMARRTCRATRSSTSAPTSAVRVEHANGEFTWKGDVPVRRRRSAMHALHSRSSSTSHEASSHGTVKDPCAAEELIGRTPSAGTSPGTLRPRSVCCYWPPDKEVFDLGTRVWPDQGYGLDARRG